MTTRGGTGQALVIAVISALLGGVVGWYIAEEQAVRQFRATELEKESVDRRSQAPILVSDVRTGDTDGGYELHETALELEQANTSTSDRGGVQVLPTSEETDDPRTTKTEIIFSVSSQLYRPVRISSIRAELQDGPLPPLTGTLLTLPAAGDSGVSQVGIDLDSTDRSALLVTPEGDLTATNFFDRRQLSLTRDGEPLTLSVSVFTAKCYCKFDLILTIDDGREVRVSNGDNPWEVSALSDRYARTFGNDVGQPYVPCTWTLGHGCASLPALPPR